MGVSQASPSFAKALLKMVTEAYPDRLGQLYAGPLNIVIRGFARAVWPFMPKRLTSKIHLAKDPAKHIRSAIGENAVPVHFGGTAEHYRAPLDVNEMIRCQEALLGECAAHVADDAESSDRS